MGSSPAAAEPAAGAPASGAESSEAPGKTEPELPPVSECPDEQFLQDGRCHLDAVQIAVGGGHFCAVLRDGSVRCLGDNSEGQLGDGSLNSSAVPVVVAGLSGVREVDADLFQTCALLADGTVSCWGRVLGSAAVEVVLTPTPVAGLEGVVSIGVGNGYACALLATRSIACWGNNSSGQLGNGTTQRAREPVRVLLAGGDVPVAMNVGSASVCVVLDTGRVKCWGELFEPTPADAGFSGALGVVTQAGMFCAWTPQGELRCFGAGMLFLDPAVDSSGTTVPTLLSGFGSVTQAALSSVSVCALDGDTGTVRCAGFNYESGLGDPSVTEDSYTPLRVVGLSDVSSLVGGGGSYCALRTDGSVWCWGGLEVFGVQRSALAAPFAGW